MNNKQVSKVVGTALNVSEGQTTRSDNAASKRPATVKLGDGNFLPDTTRLGYGSEGVTPSGGGMNGPTGKA